MGQSEDKRGAYQQDLKGHAKGLEVFYQQIPRARRCAMKNLICIIQKFGVTLLHSEILTRYDAALYLRVRLLYS